MAFRNNLYLLYLSFKFGNSNIYVIQLLGDGVQVPCEHGLQLSHQFGLLDLHYGENGSMGDINGMKSRQKLSTGT